MLSPRALDLYAGIRPWALVGAIAHFVFGAIGVLGAIGSLVAPAQPGVSRGLEALMGFLAGVASALLGYFLLRYQRGLRRFSATGETLDLEAALRGERAYWRLWGIFVLASVGIAVLAVVFLLLFTALS